MVAPYDIGDPVRSYVRVPGSGSDPTAKSLCCDLSRVSLVAASAPVLQDNVQGMSPASPPSSQSAHGTGNVEKQTAKQNPIPSTSTEGTQAETFSSKPAVQTQIGRNNAASSCGSNSCKRPLPAEEVDAEERGMPPHKVIRVTSSGAKIPKQNVRANYCGGVGINTSTREKHLSSVGTQTKDLLSEVVKERNELREKNILLERRLAAFKGIFKNKERLVQLVKCLS